MFLVTAGDRTMGFKERFFISWAGVKGVASAALAAIAVTVIISYTHNLPEASRSAYITAIAPVVPTIYAVVFTVLMVSLIVQGLSTAFLANVLNLTEKQDRAKEITVHRDATRQALLSLVDKYTEGKVNSEMYGRLKAELEEEIFELEDKLRRVVAERRAHIQELTIREEIFKSKLEFYRKEYESGKISDGVYQDLQSELEAEIEEVNNRIRAQEERIIPESD